MNDLGALLAFGFGLLGHGAEHAFRHVHLLDLDVYYFYAPGRGVGVEDALQAGVDLVAVGQQFVQFDLAQDRAQRSLSELRGLIHVVGNFNYSFARLDHAQEDDRVDLEGDVVAGNDVLRRDFQGLLPQGDAHDAVDGSEYKNDARSFGLVQQVAQPEN